MNKKYQNLLSPLKLRNVIFTNRVFVSSMGFPPTHKHPSSPKYDAGVSFYDKSQGGAAGILVSTGPANKNGEYPKYDRDQIRELMSLAGQSGSKVGAGLGLFGMDREANIHFGPSTYQKPNGAQVYEVPETKMMEFLDQLGNNAKAAKLFGFDYVQYHMAHESMCSHFMAPGFNKRTDKYGGSLENRIRYPLMAIKKIRENVGENMPIIVRLSAVLHCEESYDFEDMLEFIRLIQNDVDMINVSCGMDTWYETNVYHCTTPFQPHQINVDWAHKIKDACPDLKVCPVGGIMTPEQAENILEDGRVDAVMLGRAMNADPFWPKKVMEDRSEDIVPCLRCSYCYHAANDHNLIACSVNPRFFRENRVPLTLERAEITKKVVIIGAGPAGCKAALTAAQRGHEVILLEKTDRIGGQIKYADYDNHKTDLAHYLRYLETQVKKADIKLLVNTTATPDLVKEYNPDVLILAIGATEIIPKIPGVDQVNVHLAASVYHYLNKLGDNVAIIGGGTVGSELALTLAENGKKVVIVEASGELNSQGHMLYRIGLRHALDKVKDNIEVHLNSRCNSISDKAISITDFDKNTKDISIDDVIIAVGYQERKEEAFEFYGIANQTYSVGDCDRVGKVLEATNNAYFIAANL